MSKHDEKRQHLRIPFILRVTYADRTGLSDATENISHGGLFIQTQQKFEMGARVPLSLSFPGLLDPIEIVGRVTWIRPTRGDEVGGVGICCDRDVDRKRLADILGSQGIPEPHATAPAPLRVQALPPQGFRVLIVEDNPHIIEMYSYVLKKLASSELGGKVPFEVHFAPDGHAALGLLEASEFSLLMTDLYMPVLDGFALVEKLRATERTRTLPFIAISAGGKDAQDRALKAGVDIFLRKPVRFAEVLETVKQLLRIR